jgi:hypothetical protein
MIRERRFPGSCPEAFAGRRRLRQHAQVLSQKVRLARAKTGLNGGMGTRPHGGGAGQHLYSLRSQLEQTGALVFAVWRDFDEVAPSQGLKRGGQGCSIHRQQ